MKTLCYSLLFGLLMLSSAARAVPGHIINADNPQRIAGSYIVVLHESALIPDGLPMERAEKAALYSAYDVLAAAHGVQITHRFDTVLTGFAGRMTEAQALALSHDPSVRWVEQDQAVVLHATQTNPDWGLDRVDQRNRGLSGTYEYATAAPGVNVYVIDSGIRASHNDFGGRVKPGFSVFSDNDGRYDCNGHGTHVAGLAGGAIYGVAKGVSLYPARVHDCSGGGSVPYVVEGIDWAAEHYLSRQPFDEQGVANMSLGTDGGPSPSLDTAVQNAISQGLAVVASAGNVGGDACNQSPARVAEVITVAATDPNDNRWSDSNFGSCVDMFAPGTGILSAWHTSNTASSRLDGTSMSAPLVAGRVALLLAQNPGMTPAQVQARITGYSVTHHRVSSAGTGSPNKLLYTKTDPDRPAVRVEFTGCDGYTAQYLLEWPGNYGPESEQYDVDKAQPASDSWAAFYNGTGYIGSLALQSGETFKLRARYTVSEGTSYFNDTGTLTAPSCGGGGGGIDPK